MELDPREDPFAIALRWLEEARGSEPNDPDAAALATVDGNGMPDVRMVLVKELNGAGFTFYTNYRSVKGQELAGQPRAALVFHWKSLRRQIRARGPVERRDGADADAYYASRAPGSRIGAWASRQSQPLGSRAELMAAVEAEQARLGADPPRPPFWGGFRLVPVEMEFWSDGEFRLHDRFRWRRTTPQGDWQVTRLFP